MMRLTVRTGEVAAGKGRGCSSDRGESVSCFCSAFIVYIYFDSSANALGYYPAYATVIYVVGVEQVPLPLPPLCLSFM